jgi:hypothetical protein
MKPLARKDDLVVETILNECVVYDSNNKRAHSLNSTVAWIWRHCDGLTDQQEMANQFGREFACEESLDLILSGIQQLQAADLLVSMPQDAASTMTAARPTMTRRSVVAAGSALAPIIASVLVPDAAAAKSGQGDNNQGNQGNQGQG